MTTTPKYERVETQVAKYFPSDVAEHVLQVKYADGVFRHLDCGVPGSNNRRFTITTWPGELCISGDMGTFVFCRLHDMFEFFRSDKGRVNLSYWHEKLRAANVREGSETFVPELFRERVLERMHAHFEEDVDDGILSEEDMEDLLASVNDEVLSRAEYGSHNAIYAAMDFRWRGHEPFEEFWDVKCTDYTYYYAWCCHAIVWAIQQWDVATSGEAVS